MRLLRVTLLCIILLPALATQLFAASPDMKTGKWQVTMKMEMEGAPFPMPPVVYTQCITKNDLQDAKKTIPNSSKNKGDCDVKDYKMSGNKATWRVLCKDGTTGTGEMTYKGTSYSGVIKMETTDRKHGTSKIVQRINGKRIGDCK